VWTFCAGAARAAVILSLAAVAQAAVAQAPPVTVLVDGSGSMQGFFATGAMGELVGQLAPTRTFRFEARPDGVGGVSSRLVPFDPGAPATGAMTLLWRGLGEYLPRARPGEVIAMVTDNVQDSGTLPSEQRDVREFYGALAGSPDVSHVFIVPLRRSFDGLLYGRPGAGPIGRYTDERALVVYLIGFRQASDAAMESATQAIAARLGSAPIRMKPYRTAPVEVEVDTAATRILAAGDSCGFESLLPLAGERGVLGRRTPVEVGRPFGGRFVLKLRSTMEGVSLARPGISAEITEAFRLRSFKIEAAPVIVPDPPRLRTDLEPGDSTSIRVSVCFEEGVRFRWSRDVFLRLVSNSAAIGSYEGAVRVRLELPRADLKLADRLRREYSVVDPRFFESADPELHRRVYGLEHAFRSLASDTVRVERKADHRLRFPIRYPVWPSIVAGLIVLLLLALLAWLGYALLRSASYRVLEEAPGVFHVSREGGAQRAERATPGGPDAFLYGATPTAPSSGPTGRVVPLSFLRSYPLYVAGRTGAVLRLRPLGGVAAVARPGFMIDGTLARKPIQPAGTSFSVTGGGAAPPREDAAAPHGSPPPATPRSNRSGADPGAFLP
jgi:hypothetical protein